MAWKPKTIMGKILKGAVIGGGTLLGLTAAGRIGKGVISIVKAGKAGAAAVKGTGALAKVKTVISGIEAAKDKVIESATNVITGTNKEQREIINKQKEQTKQEAQKLTALDKLVKAGATITAARAALGLEPEQVTEYDGEKVQPSGITDFLQNKNVMYAGAALLGLFLLTRFKKR